MKKKCTVILYNVIVVLLIFGALEFYFEYKLSHPEDLNGRMKIASQNYYMKYGRQIIQYEPAMAMYDETLFYKLKPGIFTFKNREFNVTFKVNSLGVRDDESSLDNPKIVVLGDSHAMGWGIEQKETFAALLAKETQSKVLNTGISSYGTVREFQLLNQIKKDSLQYIVLQYCDNDYPENHSYYQNGNFLNISSKNVYDDVSSEHRSKGSYHIFKHVLKFPKLLVNANTESEVNQKMPDDEVEVFLNVIQQANVLNDNIKLIVFNVNGRRTTSHFIDALKLTLQDEKWKKLATQIIPLDVSAGLTAEKYHILDDHMNAKGHAFVASELKKLINLH
ncbi:hypothetical protein [Kordia sp.]|uniref:hypothetical protein n=1 Tax=Kordia sp. TaxID=1965332 RepID=UPI003B5B9575